MGLGLRCHKSCNKGNLAWLCANDALICNLACNRI